MRIVVGSYEEGQFAVRTAAQTVFVSVHWPFDRSTDEWIDATATFRKASIAQRSRNASDLELRDGDSVLTMKQIDAGRSVFMQGTNSIGKVSLECVLPNQQGDLLSEALETALNSPSKT